MAEELNPIEPSADDAAMDMSIKTDTDVTFGGFTYENNSARPETSIATTATIALGSDNGEASLNANQPVTVQTGLVNVTNYGFTAQFGQTNLVTLWVQSNGAEMTSLDATDNSTQNPDNNDAWIDTFAINAQAEGEPEDPIGFGGITYTPGTGAPEATATAKAWDAAGNEYQEALPLPAGQSTTLLGPNSGYGQLTGIVRAQVVAKGSNGPIAQFTMSAGIAQLSGTDVTSDVQSQGWPTYNINILAS